MASNTINQGAVNGIVIKPIWGTLDKQEEDDSVDRFIAIVDSIRKLVDSKADIDHNHDDRYYTEPEIDTKFLAIDAEISQINSKLTPMYGYCETAASVAAKTVTITNFTLVTGRTVYIKFEHENSADDPTLNISGTGAIRIVRYGTDPVSEQEIQWSDGEVKCFTYDGISWIESGGAGGGSDRSDTISFHGSDMIVEPGTNRITFDDSDMIIHPPDGAAWLERTMEALEGGISIISTNNEHAAISNGQYVYIRMHTSLPDGLYKATTDIAQNAELSASNVTSASGALNDKSNVGHIHDDRYYTETETDTKLNGKVTKSGDTMTGSLTVIGNYFQKNNSPDVTQPNNGLSGTVGYSFNRTDKNGLAVAYFDGYVRADGSIASAFGAINYNTSGARVATLGMMINVQKNGTGVWTVSEPASFRNAIGAAAASNPVIINNPYDVVDSTVLSLNTNDNLLIVCGNLVYCSVRFDMKKTTTGSTRALAFKSAYNKYLPFNYSNANANGVVFMASECWTAATQGMVYMNGTLQIGISGGFQNGKGYIGTVTYLIN